MKRMVQFMLDESCLKTRAHGRIALGKHFRDLTPSNYVFLLTFRRLRSPRT